MPVKEITISTAPTIVIQGDYIKAGASVTITIPAGADPEAEVQNAKTLLKKTYFETLKMELINVTSIQKRKSRLRVVQWLKGILDGKEDQAK